MLSDTDTWLDRHGDALYRYALLRVRQPDVAEDLVQDTLLAALRARASYAGQANERTWLVAILKNKIIDHFRRAARETPLPDLPEPDDTADGFFHGEPAGHWTEIPATWGRPDTCLEQMEFWRAFRDCLDKLPERQARVFALTELDELSTPELCKALGISPSNAWVLLHRARLRLRDCLERSWFGIPAEHR
jgi:RNA polymerase sigma-70 factor (ECF subfamily)